MSEPEVEALAAAGYEPETVALAIAMHEVMCERYHEHSVTEHDASWTFVARAKGTRRVLHAAGMTVAPEQDAADGAALRRLREALPPDTALAFAWDPAAGWLLVVGSGAGAWHGQAGSIQEVADAALAAYRERYPEEWR